MTMSNASKWSGTAGTDGIIQVGMRGVTRRCIGGGHDRSGAVHIALVDHAGGPR